MRFARFSKELTEKAGFSNKRSKIGLKSDGTKMVRLAGADMSDLWRKAYFRDEQSCVDCKVPAWKEKLELSHDISRGRGGSDELENVHMRCIPCHRKRDNNQVRFS